MSEKAGMIFSIGYENLSTGGLEALVQTLDAVIIDCRAVPRSRKPGFGQRQLERLLGKRYEAHGHHLGGRSKGAGVQPSGIAMLRERKARGERLILMCMEAAPYSCHRHHDIALAAKDLYVYHVMEHLVIRADVYHKHGKDFGLTEEHFAGYVEDFAPGGSPKGIVYHEEEKPTKAPACDDKVEPTLPALRALVSPGKAHGSMLVHAGGGTSVSDPDRYGTDMDRIRPICEAASSDELRALLRALGFERRGKGRACLVQDAVDAALGKLYPRRAA